MTPAIATPTAVDQPDHTRDGKRFLIVGRSIRSNAAGGPSGALHSRCLAQDATQPRCRPCYAFCVIEPGTSNTSTPSGSRTVARVIGPFLEATVEQIELQNAGMVVR
jgi:hypothetical protein